MKRIFPKSKLVCVNVGFLIVILGGILLVESGSEPWLDSEKVFMARLHNSLYYLDQAKSEWAAKKNEPETAVPTLDDLAPYLGKWKDTIDKLKALGIVYKITSLETNQADVATLTRGIRFRAAVCPYYRAGTSLCLNTGWKSPPLSSSPMTLRSELILLRAGFFLRAAILILVLSNVIIFFVRRHAEPSSPPESTDAAAIKPDSPALVKIRARDLYVLIFGSLFCVLGLAFVALFSIPGETFIENMGNGVGVFLTCASLVLPILCLRFLKANTGARPAFFISLVPATCILWAFLSTWFSNLPFYVKERATKQIIKGMTKAQVLDAIGSPRSSSGGGADGKMRLTYDYQIPWGRSGRQFFVDIINDKVVSAKIVRYGGEPNDDFWESDFIKDLKVGKALPGKMEVQPETNRTSTAAASGG